MPAGRPPLIPRALTRAEYHSVVSAFLQGTRTLGLFDCYWLPIERRLALRRVVCSKNRDANYVPHDAIYMGRYSAPYSGAEFARDLDDWLADERGEVNTHDALQAMLSALPAFVPRAG